MANSDDVVRQSGMRRMPLGETRQRDAERSRELLLEAALDEFAAKGFAGARVQDIAARAGVNKQLISYYFGGKAGLYRATAQRWLDIEASFASQDLPLEDLVVEYLRTVLDDPRLLRLLIWDGLSTPVSEPVEADEDAEAFDDVAEYRRRQDSGEIADDLDPGLFLLAITGIVAAPVVMPRVARRITDLDFQSPEFKQAYAEQVRRIIRHLAD
jgi:TetR/AcrR family transcriptional regulator